MDETPDKGLQDADVFRREWERASTAPEIDPRRVTAARLATIHAETAADLRRRLREGKRIRPITPAEAEERRAEAARYGEETPPEPDTPSGDLPALARAQLNHAGAAELERRFHEPDAEC